MGILKGKTVLVTGGSRGIGAAIVREAMEEGADVGFTYANSVADAEILVGEMEGVYFEQKCVAYQCDVTDTTGMAEMTNQFVEEFGKVDVLVNNAGIIQDSALARMTREAWDAVINTNLGGLFNTTQPLILQFVKQRGGSIINMSSQMGHVGGPNRSLYCASKWALEGMNKAFALDLAKHNIRSNTICPTFIETPLTKPFFEDETFKASVLAKIKLGRIGQVEDLMGAAVFLASDASALMTGSSLVIDGGWTAD